MNREKLKKLMQSKTLRIVLVCIAALLLLLVTWKVFSPKQTGTATTAAYQMTAEEARLSAILSEIEGVKEATVYIRTADGVPVSAVVLFWGQDSILTRTYLIDVTSRALGIAARDVLVQPAC